jgi:hypothetical protein
MDLWTVFAINLKWKYFNNTMNLHTECEIIPKYFSIIAGNTVHREMDIIWTVFVISLKWNYLSSYTLKLYIECKFYLWILSPVLKVQCIDSLMKYCPPYPDWCWKKKELEINIEYTYWKYTMLPAEYPMLSKYSKYSQDLVKDLWINEWLHANDAEKYIHLPKIILQVFKI